MTDEIKAALMRVAELWPVPVNRAQQNGQVRVTARCYATHGWELAADVLYDPALPVGAPLPFEPAPQWFYASRIIRTPAEIPAVFSVIHEVLAAKILALP